MYAHNVHGQHRDLLRAAGFSFSDESEQKPDPKLRQAGATLREAEHAHSAPPGTLCPLHNLLRNGVTASTCDHDVQQNIGMKAVLMISGSTESISSTSLFPQETLCLMMMISGVVRHLGPINKNICCTALPHPAAKYMVCKSQFTEQDISWGARHHNVHDQHAHIFCHM